MEQRKTRDRHIPSPAGAEMNAYRVRDVPSLSLFNAAFPGRTNIPTPRPKSEQGNAPACGREESKKLTGKWWRIGFWKPDGGLGEPEPVSQSGPGFVQLPWAPPSLLLYFSPSLQQDLPPPAPRVNYTAVQYVVTFN